MPNFLENPGGTSSGRSIPNLVQNPGGRNAVPQQRSGEAADLASVAPGGRILEANATPGPTKDIGVGSVGNGASPFRVTG